VLRALRIAETGARSERKKELAEDMEEQVTNIKDCARDQSAMNLPPESMPAIRRSKA
jgi:hypothetical protein